MDFHSLVRRDLQFLCKRNGIPANMTNIAMADALQALDSVDGFDEMQLQPQSVKKSAPSRTAATRKAAASVEDEDDMQEQFASSPLLGSRRIMAKSPEAMKRVIDDGEDGKVHDEPDDILRTPAAGLRSSQRIQRTAAKSSVTSTPTARQMRQTPARKLKATETPAVDSKEDGAKACNVPRTAKQSSRRAAPVAPSPALRRITRSAAKMMTSEQEENKQDHRDGTSIGGKSDETIQEAQNGQVDRKKLFDVCMELTSGIQEYSNNEIHKMDQEVKVNEKKSETFQEAVTNVIHEVSNNTAALEIKGTDPVESAAVNVSLVDGIHEPTQQNESVYVEEATVDDNNDHNRADDYSEVPVFIPQVVEKSNDFIDSPICGLVSDIISSPRATTSTNSVVLPLEIDLTIKENENEESKLTSSGSADIVIDDSDLLAPLTPVATTVVPVNGQMELPNDTDNDDVVPDIPDFTSKLATSAPAVNALLDFTLVAAPLVPENGGVELSNNEFQVDEVDVVPDFPDFTSKLATSALAVNALPDYTPVAASLVPENGEVELSNNEFTVDVVPESVDFVHGSFAKEFLDDSNFFDTTLEQKGQEIGLSAGILTSVADEKMRLEVKVAEKTVSDDQDMNSEFICNEDVAAMKSDKENVAHESAAENTAQREENLFTADDIAAVEKKMEELNLKEDVTKVKKDDLKEMDLENMSLRKLRAVYKEKITSAAAAKGLERRRRALAELDENKLSN